MATRAERFRAEQERTHPKAAPPPGKRAQSTAGKVDKKIRLERAVSGTVRGRADLETGLRNLTNGKHGIYALEDTMGGAPSRKSTRRANRAKAATTLTSRQQLKNGAPAVRHGRRT